MSGESPEPQRTSPGADAVPESSAALTAEPKPGKTRRRLRRALLLLGPVAVAVVGGHLYLSGGRYAETENAYVKADKVAISAQVSGPIVEVAVRENQPVAIGDILFRIDGARYKVALARAEAHLSSVREEIESLKASYRQKVADLALARADAAFAEREFERQSTLAKKNVVSEAKLDQARHDLDVAWQRTAMTRQEIAEIRAQLGGDVDIAVERQSRFREARAARDAAVLALRHTVVRAPFAGIASNKPERGQYVQPGVPVMSVVADKDVWIEANFKETELTHMEPGQPVSIRVDAYPAHVWHGTVASISQATGAEFAIIPPQNATGNWVKVVQRIPVRIAVQTADGGPVLRAGMSSAIEIDTGYRRPLPGFLRAALSWITGPALAGTSEHRPG